MLPEDGHSESVREDKPVIEGVRDTAGEEGARTSTPKPDEIRIDGKIGTDPEELKRWADHVVAGNAIEHMEIADLRALIEAVQAHPEATLAPDADDEACRLSSNEREAMTHIVIKHGTIRGGNCRMLDARVAIVVESRFLTEMSFEWATFWLGAFFAGSVFDRNARFDHATLCNDASFGGARFWGLASFHGTTCRGEVSFEEAIFRDVAIFDGIACLANASYETVFFGKAAEFEGAMFASDVRFDGTRFEDRTGFDGATFGGRAYFDEAGFRSEASFDRAVFLADVWFDSAAFHWTTWMDSVFSFRSAVFDGSIFNNTVSGDMRSADMSGAYAALMSTRRRHSPWIVIGAWQERESRLASLIAAHREEPWKKLDAVPSVFYRACRAVARPVVILRELWPLHRENKAFWRVLRQMIRSRLIYGAVGWNLVRALGRLSILNRVSLIALIAVPVLAAAYGAAQKIVTAPNGASAPVWIKWFARAIGGSPHLSETLALTFFAAVLVTIGLLIYQVFAPDTIKQRDEDEHVRDLETRYSDENPSLRGDGLRRSIERLEDQAKVRPNRHPSFVKHHGDMIWIPPRDKPEWFKDDDLEEAPFRARVREALRESRDRLGQPTDDASLDGAMKKLDIIPPKQRPGFVPGAERARICIEEGARAEYWLKAHEKIGWAWMSLVCYLLGIAILLVILFIQCRSVARAAWWPEATQDATRSTG